MSENRLNIDKMAEILSKILSEKYEADVAISFMEKGAKNEEVQN